MASIEGIAGVSAGVELGPNYLLLTTYLLASLPPYLLTSLPACLPAYLLAYHRGVEPGPNYGTDVYWFGGPPAASMLDTSGIPDSLPLTSLSMDTALLQWGGFDSALSIVGLYFEI